MKAGNYIVARVPTDRGTTELVFGRVVSTEAEHLHIRKEQDCHIRKVHHKVLKSKSIDLGPTPPAGKVYGFDTTNLYIKATAHALGEFHWFYKPTKEVHKTMVQAVAELEQRLNKLKLPVPDDSVIWVLRKGTPKHAGWYINSKNVDKKPHQFGFVPDHFGDTKPLYILAHEYAHWLYFNHVGSNAELSASWVAMFNRSVKTAPIKADLNALLKAWLKSQLPANQFAKSLEDEDRSAFTRVVSTMCKMHRLDLHDLEVLMLSNKLKTLHKMWQVSVHQHETVAFPLLTAYSTTNVKELFSEALAHAITGLPVKDPELKDLVQRTISIVRN